MKLPPEITPTPQHLAEIDTADFGTEIHQITSDLLCDQVTVPAHKVYNTFLYHSPSSIDNHVTISCSAYIQVLLQFDISKQLRSISESDVVWSSFPFSKTTSITSHVYWTSSNQMIPARMLFLTLGSIINGYKLHPDIYPITWRNTFGQTIWHHMSNQ